MKLSWQSVIVVLAVVAAVMTLLVLGKDVSVMLGLASTILGAVLLSNSQQIKQNTNGNMTAAFAELANTRRALEELARTTVPVSTVPVSTVPVSTGAPAPSVPIPVAVPALPAQAATAQPEAA